MQQELVSLIITTYNSDKYLNRCLDSVVKQTYKNLEIIIVDDGSTDTSGKICDAYAARDKRLHILHQQNAGVSVARNHAVALATGEYLGFTDADDRLEPDYVETLVKNMQGYDMVLCGYHFIKGEGVIVERHLAHNCVLTAPDFLRAYLDDDLEASQGLEIKPRMGGYLWNKLFRRRVWGDLQFVPHLDNQDTLAVTAYLGKISKVNCITACPYNYYFIPGSVTNRPWLNEHTGDLVVIRQKQRALIKTFLQQNPRQDHSLLAKSELLLLIAYMDVVAKYVRAGQGQAQPCLAYVENFRKEFGRQFPCKQGKSQPKFAISLKHPGFV